MERFFWWLDFMAWNSHQERDDKAHKDPNAPAKRIVKPASRTFFCVGDIRLIRLKECPNFAAFFSKVEEESATLKTDGQPEKYDIEATVAGKGQPRILRIREDHWGDWRELKRMLQAVWEQSEDPLQTFLVRCSMVMPEASPPPSHEQRVSGKVGTELEALESHFFDDTWYETAEQGGEVVMEGDAIC